MLQLGIYQTRVGRIAELSESEIRTKSNTDGSTKQVKVCRGNLFKANGKDVESVHEWEENERPEPPPPGWAYGAFVQQSAVEGVPHQFDLVTLVELKPEPAPASVEEEPVPEAQLVAQKARAARRRDPAPAA